MLEEGRFAILNQVTFEQSPGGGEGGPAAVLGEEQFRQGTASAETGDLIHSRSYSAPRVYRLFLFYILVILKITLLSCTLQLI